MQVDATSISLLDSVCEAKRSQLNMLDSLVELLEQAALH